MQVAEATVMTTPQFTELPLVTNIFVGPNETPNQILFWDGFGAACEGQPLEDMPTERQKKGWWFAMKCAGDTEVYSVEDDHAWIKGGC